VNYPQILKYNQKLGFCWDFLERVQTEFFSNRDQNLQQLGVCSGPKSATHHQSILKPNPLKGIKGFSTTTQDRGKGETKTIKLQKFQQGYKPRFKTKEPCGLDRQPFLKLNMKIKNTIEVQNRCESLGSIGVYQERKLVALE
jgi:hypothetical protein